MSNLAEQIEVELGREVSSATEPQPPPISNLQHAFIVIASTTLVFTVCGIAFAFGVYQELYESMSHIPSSPFYGSSPAEIDLIGTLAISLMTIGAPFATAWTKRYPPYLVIWSGSVVFFGAFLLASFSQRLWQFELTQGFLAGVGTCLSYICPPSR
ncbi:uncharacterized protein Z518_03179 [Rhinocladiella mackenziei CBS 650.93]|uniref:Major facilitator superfamily (MFS) profile domain-containing protein n=1 Tax=Rhinocladiella mackenziei CBS 650.93 TaxID=1442369 RepID=A0A0D2HDF6_9EURO|nr:uncharacterized protein Z518_03179 [Rhinocladiella mackenziei CBS 650.93]KIX08523.1 hypothetical protein Z518_03179 [Rhinocladiella mackenziei CBS 650.93]